jgi:hypothetical protein
MGDQSGRMVFGVYEGERKERSWVGLEQGREGESERGKMGCRATMNRT